MNKIFNYYAFISFGLFFLLTFHIAEGRLHVAYQLPDEPVIDGMLDEKTWIHAANEGGDFMVLRTARLSSSQTFFRVGYTDRALYFCIICEDQNTDNIIKGTADMGELWNDDSVEIFIQPQKDTENFLQFIVNAGGNRFLRDISGRSSAQALEGWKAEASIKDGYWLLEVKIPWDIFDLKPEPNDRWTFNIARNVRGVNQEPTTWANLERRFHEPENFAALEFGREIPTAEKTELEEIWQLLAERREGLYAYSRPLDGTFTHNGRLFYNQGKYIKPRISPCAEKVLFTSMKGSEKGVWVINIENGQKSRICDGSQGRWSPDGTAIVLKREEEIIEKNLLSKAERKISPAGWGSCEFPFYGPDGKIYFVKDRRIYAEQKVDSPLVETESMITSVPAICPAGERLAYQDGAHIYIFNLADGRKSQATFAPGLQSSPVWTSDGESIVYCQLHDPLAISGDLYHTIERGGKAGLLEREIHPGFDWVGARLDTIREAELWAGNIVFWKGDDDFDSEKGGAILKKEGTAPEKVKIPDGKGVLIGRPDNYIHIPSKSGGIYFSMGNGQAQIVMEIVFKDISGRVVDRVKQVNWREISEEKVALTVVHAANDGENHETKLTLLNSRNMLELKPVKNTGTVLLKCDLEYIAIPDRIGNDFVASLDELKSLGGIKTYPSARLLLGMVQKGKGIISFISTTPEERTITICEKNDLVVLSKPFNDKAVGVAGAFGETLWQSADVEKEGEKWKTEWTPPFFATWRAVLMSPYRNYSMMLNEKRQERLNKDHLALENTNIDNASRALIYLFGRSLNTPLEVITPKDTVLSLLNIENALEILQTLDARIYQTSSQWVPYEHSNPQLMEDFKFLDAFAGWGVRRSDPNIESVRRLSKHLCYDAINLLKNLDRRIEEFDTFISELKNIEGSESMPVIRTVQQAVKENIVNAIEFTPLEEVSRAAETVIEDYSRWGPLRNSGRQALQERQKAIIKYRDLVKKLRDEAKKMYMSEPQTCRQSRSLIESSRHILTARYYLENDWRDEIPAVEGDH